MTDRKAGIRWVMFSDEDVPAVAGTLRAHYIQMKKAKVDDLIFIGGIWGEQRQLQMSWRRRLRLILSAHVVNSNTSNT